MTTSPLLPALRQIPDTQRQSLRDKVCETLFETGHDAVFVYRLEADGLPGRFLDVNRRACDWLGYERDELLVLTPFDVLTPDALAEHPGRKLLDGRPQRFETRLRRRDGETLFAESTAHLLEFDGRPAVLSVVRDITLQVRAESRLRHHAYHDQLTGLPNRTLLQESLQALIDGGRHDFALLFLDLDRFKLVNDGLGHTFGDSLLQGIGRRLAGCLREEDLIARYGGDEFVVLLRPADAVQARATAQRILDALARPFDFQEQEIFTNASIGIVIGDGHYRNPDEVLRDADTAMYHAKHAGRGCYAVFDTPMREQAQRRLALETQLQRALEREELRLHYEPIMQLESGRPVAFEALLRWRHPQLGLLQPAEFLPLTEETGLIIAIGAWVLEAACRQAMRWPERLRVSVNIADRQFAHPHLVEHVRRALDNSGLPADRLQLEITESVFMENRAAAARQFQRLRELGVRIHMDDFGTGYSSLAVLRQHRPDALKIDRGFVQHVETDRDSRALIHTMLCMAGELDMEAVAEGVERQRQADILHELGCRLVQGHFYGHSLHGAASEAWLDECFSR